VAAPPINDAELTASNAHEKLVEEEAHAKAERAEMHRRHNCKAAKKAQMKAKQKVVSDDGIAAVFDDDEVSPMRPMRPVCHANRMPIQRRTT